MISAVTAQLRKEIVKTDIPAISAAYTISFLLGPVLVFCLKGNFAKTNLTLHLVMHIGDWDIYHFTIFLNTFDISPSY